MRATTPRLYAVITADVVASSGVPGFTRLRDQKLGRLSTEHLEQKLVLEPYTVTTWDEFQNVLTDVACAPQVIWDLRRLMYPLALRIGVGIGRIIEPLRPPINAFAGGQAFELARQALDRMQSGKGQKFPRLTQFRSVDTKFDQIANLIYGLHDTLMAKLTPKQWATISVQAGTRNQDATARKLRVKKSTVSRNLQRGFYWQMEETVEVMREILRGFFAVAQKHATLEDCTSPCNQA